MLQGTGMYWDCYVAPGFRFTLRNEGLPRGTKGPSPAAMAEASCCGRGRPCRWSGESVRKLVFQTLDIALNESDFYDGIRQVACANMFQGCGEKFALLRRDHVGKDNDHAGVERFLAVEIKKIGAIVGDERVLLLPYYSHKLPIFQAAESAVTDMVRAVARRMGDGDQGRVQAFVNQKLHVGVAVFRR